MEKSEKEGLIISDRTSDGNNYAILEDGVVKAVLNEETKKRGYMPMSEAKAFARSLIEAKILRDFGPDVGLSDTPEITSIPADNTEEYLRSIGAITLSEFIEKVSKL